ncbi:MAG: S-methyl-5'-thioadenosine phosphorylase [Nitrospira sp.]|nr:S-methyl-5'-thioadenosine phosphorylase [Nitrospira sp.]
MSKSTRREAPMVAVIGGSGLYAMEELKNVAKHRIRTPFGAPSGPVMVGLLDGVPVAFLARHGSGHRMSPSAVNYRANIYALKSLGVTRVLAVSAVGSLKEAIAPGHVVVPDQFIDLTKRRPSTFFEDGIVAHVAFGDPVCAGLADKLITSARLSGATIHAGGTYVCIEGPHFSTKSESRLYRQWGADIIGMTNMPEAKLAREAELCYATLALVTDYDCWHATQEAVTVEAILATLHRTVELAKRVLRAAIPSVAAMEACVCQHALDHAIVTDRKKIPSALRRKLALLTRRVWS